MKYSKARTLVDEKTGERFEVSETVKTDKEGNFVSRCFISVSDPANLSLGTNEIVSTDKLAVTETEKLAKKKVRPTWMHTYILQNMSKLASTPLSVTAYRVWFSLPLFMTWGNYVNCSLAEVSEKVGIDPANISRALKELETHDMLVRTGRGAIMANPTVCWLGYANDQQRAVAEYYRQRINATAKDKAAKKAKAKKEKAKTQATDAKVINLSDRKRQKPQP